MRRNRFAHLPVGSREMVSLLGELMRATFIVERWPQVMAYAHQIGEVIAGWREVKLARGGEWSNDEDIALQNYVHRGWELLKQSQQLAGIDSEEADRVISKAACFVNECASAMSRRARRDMQRREDERNAWERRSMAPFYFGQAKEG